MPSARIDYAPVEEPSKFHSFRSLRLVTLESTVCAREEARSARARQSLRAVCAHRRLAADLAYQRTRVSVMQLLSAMLKQEPSAPAVQLAAQC
jgi:hypothetical protein